MPWRPELPNSSVTGRSTRHRTTPNFAYPLMFWFEVRHSAPARTYRQAMACSLQYRQNCMPYQVWYQHRKFSEDKSGKEVVLNAVLAC